MTHLCTPRAWHSHQCCRSSVCCQLGQTYCQLSFSPLNLSREMDGVSFTIASIFIHDQIDYMIVSFYKGCTWTTSRPWSSELSTPVTVHFLEDQERILTSDPASPPLSPLPTKEPC